MLCKHTKESLIAFEERVVESFKNKEIRAPVHLYHGNEDVMLDIFSNITEDAWVFCSWRSHYQCLLKGVPEEELLEEIKKGHSISLNFPEYNIFSSAIVGGNIPIAVGVAMAEKMDAIGKPNHVWCFVGDMTSETGTFYENYKYSLNYDLPITFIIEDNGKSVCTDTYDTWGQERASFYTDKWAKFDKIIYYQYETIYPHAGVGERIQF